MRVKPAIAVTLVILLVAAATGCGEGGGSVDGEEGSAPTKEQFVGRANAICEQEREELPERVADFEQARGGEPPEPYGDMVHFVFLPTIEDELSKIERIELPARDRQRIDTAIFAQQSAIDNVANTPRASLRDVKRHFARPAGMLREVGLTSCIVGENPLAPTGS